MLRHRFPPGVPRMKLAVIIRGGRPVSPAGHDLLLHFHLVLLHDFDPLPVVLVGIRRPALVFLMLLHLLLLFTMLLVLLLSGRLLFRIAPRVPVRVGTDVLLLVLPATAAGTFLTLPATPLHLQILRTRTIRLGCIRRARAGAALVLLLRFAHRATPESIIPRPKSSFNETLPINPLRNRPKHRHGHLTTGANTDCELPGATNESVLRLPK